MRCKRQTSSLLFYATKIAELFNIINCSLLREFLCTFALMKYLYLDNLLNPFCTNGRR